MKDGPHRNGIELRRLDTLSTRPPSMRVLVVTREVAHVDISSRLVVVPEDLGYSDWCLDLRGKAGPRTLGSWTGIVVLLIGDVRCLWVVGLPNRPACSIDDGRHIGVLDRHAGIRPPWSTEIVRSSWNIVARGRSDVALVKDIPARIRDAVTTRCGDGTITGSDHANIVLAEPRSCVLAEDEVGRSLDQAARKKLVPCL